MGAPTPTTLDGFTPRWLTHELRRTGTISSDTTVTAGDQTILGEGEGFMGIIARLSMSYDGPAGPASMIAKIPTTVDANRAIGRGIGVYEREVRTYTDVLPNVDVPTPKVYSAIYEATGGEPKEHRIKTIVDRLPLRVLRKLIKRQQSKADVPPCVLLLEDMVDAEVGDQVAGGSRAQVESVLSVLARWHASTWNGRNIPDAHWSQGPEYINRIVQAIYLNGRDEFLRQGAPYLSAHSIALYESLQETGIERVERHRDEVPQALAHGDVRLDNMFFDANGSVVAVIDWQTASPGPAPLDVGYFLVSSLAAETPETEVDDLLAGYHAELVANGVSDYPLDRFLADYTDALLIVLHRLTGLADMVDLGDGRGADLMALWFGRLDARLQRVPAAERPRHF